MQRPPLTVFQSSTGPYPCIRIPSTLALPDGNTILAFAECRRWAGDQCFVRGIPNASREQEFNRSVCMRRSIDGGQTWGLLQPNITHRYSANPSAVLDSARNRTLLFFDDAQTRGLYFIASRDAGVTWDAPTRLRDASGAVLSGVNGPGNSAIALRNGALLVAVYHPDRNIPPNVSFSHANILRSLDGGKTWLDVSPPAIPPAISSMFAHLGEPSLSLLPSGQLVLNSRCPDGRKPYPGPKAPCDCQCRGTSISSDGGSTWSATVFDPAVPDPDCEGAVLGLANGSVAFSNANNPRRRVNPSIRLGRLVGTPPAQSLVWDAHAKPLATATTSAGYSTLCQDARGRVGVLWETEGEQVVRGCHGEGCSIVLSFVS
jgi:hypothetical protein